MAAVHHLPRPWLPILPVPSDHDLEVCVIDREGIHALVFPVRKDGGAWIDAASKKPIDVQPTHWRLWSEKG